MQPTSCRSWRIRRGTTPWSSSQSRCPAAQKAAPSLVPPAFVRQGVKLRLGQPFVPELVSEGAAAEPLCFLSLGLSGASGGEVVLWCVGTKPRASELFVDRSVLSLELCERGTWAGKSLQTEKVMLAVATSQDFGERMIGACFLFTASRSRCCAAMARSVSTSGCRPDRQRYAEVW